MTLLPEEIRCGLVVTMPGSQARDRGSESALDTQSDWPGHSINVWLVGCGGLSMVLLQLKDPLETTREEKGISSHFRVSISSRYDLSVSLPVELARDLWYGS